MDESPLQQQGDPHDEEHYRRLIKRYTEKKSTPEELEVFLHLVRENKLDRSLLQQMNQDLGLQEPSGEEESPRVIPLWRRWQIAASFIALLGLGIFMITRLHHPATATADHPPVPADKQPGGNNAILTLANGDTIVLNNAGNGQLAVENKVSINKTDSGRIVYNPQQTSSPNPSSSTTNISYNTITTPAGGQYQLVLSDGTKVWLNALTSIHYPTRFTGKDRTVEINGEAYLEIAADPSTPFHVISRHQVVDVLGTRFNINTYADEPNIRTTLLEGKLRIVNSTNNQSVLLAPGQQSSLAVQSPEANFALTEADPEITLAWKNGLFQLNNTDLRVLLRQIARWYNVRVEYAPGYQERKFTGVIGRDVNLSSVIEMLTYAHVKLSLENNTLTIRQ